MRPEALEHLADKIADGQDIPWDEVIEASPESQRPVLEELRTLAEVARVHRTTDLYALGPEPPDTAPGAPPPSTTRRPSRQRWGHLDLIERLGAGSYGEVFRAWDTHLEREVALKLLYRPPGKSPEGSTVLPEARLLARVRHPNVPAVFGAQVHDGRVGQWTELIEGQTLAEVVGTLGPLSAAEAMLVGLAICRALSAVHAAGVLHRDIKAQNVMRAVGGRIMLMDFGAGGQFGPNSPQAATLTGTPAYIAPEVLRGEAATVRSDIYSLGVLLYFLVTGKFPVGGSTPAEVRQAHANGHRTPLESVRSDLPHAFVRLVERACAPSPEDRYSAAATVEQALAQALGVGEAQAQVQRPRRIRTRRVAVLAALGLALVAAWFLSRPTAAVYPIFERLTFQHGKVHNARFGPDGGTILYSASWGRERPRVFLTSTGLRESRPVGPPNANLLAFSPRGEMALAVNPEFLRGYVEAGVLARAPLSGGKPREVLEGVQAADWSPTGAELAVVRDVGGRTRLEFPIGQVVYDSSGWISSPRVSPDGSSVAFLDHPTPNDDSGRVALIQSGEPMKVLTRDWVSAQGLAWSPDGRELWFAASEAGNMRAVHAVTLGGDTRLVHRGATKLRLQDVSDVGALITASQERVELLARGPDDAQERDLSWLDWSIVRDLSHDGRTVLINESGEGGGERYGIYLRDLAGGDAVRLGEGSGMSLSPDGQWVLALSRGEERRLFLVPTRTGSPRPLPWLTGLRYQQWGGWFPDGTRIVFAAREEGKGTRLFVQAVDGQSLPTPITPEGVTLGSANAVAPDGARIAAVGPSGRVSIYDSKGQLLREVQGAEPGELPIQWTADGQSLYVAARGAAPVRIYLVQLDTGARALWRELMPGASSGAQEILRVVISREGSTYADSLARELSDLYVMRTSH